MNFPGVGGGTRETEEEGGKERQKERRGSIWVSAIFWVFPLITGHVRATNHHPFKCYYGPKIYSICLQAAFILTVMSTHPTSAVQGAAHGDNTSRAAKRHLQHTELYMNAPMSTAVWE